MPTTAQVKVALAALLSDPRPDSHRADPEAIVAAAERALADVARAADWVADGGEHRLRSAVERAGARGDAETATRGEHTLETLDAFRAAAAGDSSTPDHFHPGRTTLLGGDGLRSDR